MSCIITSFVCLLLCVCLIDGIRVCPTLSDYNWWLNSRCYDNPVGHQNITEIIRDWGVTAEEHFLTTQDGYQILVERLYSNISQSTPIVIVHGIAMSALGWVIRGKESLPYLLAIQGYDVWLVNYRGTWYSKRHVRLSPQQNEFWKFNINDMGIYDIRTTLKHVNVVTHQQALYIGFSMGTTGFFIYSTTFPDEATRYVKGMIGLAPVINYKDIKSYLTYIVPVWPTLKNTVYSLWHGEILPSYSVLLKPLVELSFGIEALQESVNLMFGNDNEQLDPTTYPLFMTVLLDTMGAEVMSHYIQIYQAGRFQNYDHGEQENMKRYGSTVPPPYNLSKVSVPVALFVGANDWLATETNAKQLYSELAPSFRCGYHVVPFDYWNHIDFLVAKDLRKYLYEDLFRKIKQMISRKCAT